MIAQPKDIAELIELLEDNGIEHSIWGMGAYKSLGQLLTEINEGESELFIDQRGRLARRVAAVGIDAYYHRRGQAPLYLIEQRQLFNSGAERRRNLKTSLAEKRRPEEVPIAAAHRALLEELGLDLGAELILNGSGQEIKPSRSYPGLGGIYDYHDFIYWLPPADYRSEGYVEMQPDKQTFFVWTASTGMTGTNISTDR